MVSPLNLRILWVLAAAPSTHRCVFRLGEPTGEQGLGPHEGCSLQTSLCKKDLSCPRREAGSACLDSGWIRREAEHWDAPARSDPASVNGSLLSS